jgi:hypothetical protein
MINTPQKAANQIVEHIRPSVIAKNLGISPTEFTPILAQAVVLGYIRKSDILFTFPKSLCDAIERMNPARSPAALHRILPGIEEMLEIEEHTDGCEAFFLWAFTRQRVVYSDLYEMLSTIETSLHKRIRQCLGNGFWRRDDMSGSKGVPLAIRKACFTRQQEDENPSDDPYSYTTFIELKEIIDVNWDIFCRRLPAGTKDKKILLSNFGQLNSIRNKVMHPVRLDGALGESEYRFVLQMHNSLVTSPWR